MTKSERFTYPPQIIPFSHRTKSGPCSAARRPNSGYAFVVNDSASRQSWHGCKRLPAGAGVRNTLLNTFYAEPRQGYEGYVEEPAEAPATA
jgi:hypothetical protein